MKTILEYVINQKIKSEKITDKQIEDFITTDIKYHDNYIFSVTKHLKKNIPRTQAHIDTYNNLPIEFKRELFDSLTKNIDKYNVTGFDFELYSLRKDTIYFTISNRENATIGGYAIWDNDDLKFEDNEDGKQCTLGDIIKAQS